MIENAGIATLLGLAMTLIGLLFAINNYFSKQISSVEDKAEILSQTVRVEMFNNIAKIQEDVKRLEREYVSRQELQSLEARVMSGIQKLEFKLDRITESLMNNRWAEKTEPVTKT